MPLLVVVGYGPGNAHAIAKRFGAEGYTVARVGCDPDRLRGGADRLVEDGVTAHPYVGDAGNPGLIRPTLQAIRSDHGPISTIALTAYRGSDVSDVLSAQPEQIGQAFHIGVTGLLTIAQTSLPDMRSAQDAAMLVLNGAVGDDTSDADRFATSFGVGGVALECAAKSKLVGLLAERLRGADIYVGELVINGTIKGSRHASPTAIDPADIADRLWTLKTVLRLPSLCSGFRASRSNGPAPFSNTPREVL